MAVLKLNIECGNTEAVALRSAIAVGRREGAAALARFCKAVAGGGRDAKVSVAPPPAAAPAKKKAAKKAKE